jgi:hypothetical protein
MRGGVREIKPPPGATLGGFFFGLQKTNTGVGLRTRWASAYV